MESDKPDIDDKKWGKLDTTIECVLNTIAAIIAQIIGTAWFDGSLIAIIIIVIILVSLLSCMKQFILSVIYNSSLLRKPFEKRKD